MTYKKADNCKGNTPGAGLKTPRPKTLDFRASLLGPLTSTSIALSPAELANAMKTQSNEWFLMKLWENPQNLRNLVELLRDPEHADKTAGILLQALELETDIQPVGAALWEMLSKDCQIRNPEYNEKLWALVNKARIKCEINGPLVELLWKPKTKMTVAELSDALDAAKDETAAKQIIGTLANTAANGTARHVRLRAQDVLLTLVKKDVDITMTFQILKDILTSRSQDINSEERLGIVKLVFEAVKKGADPLDILPETIKFATNGSVFYHMRSEHDIIIMGFLIFLCTDDRYKEKYRDYIISKMIEAGVPSEMDSRFTQETGRRMNLDPITLNFLTKANERYVNISTAVPKLFEMLGCGSEAIDNSTYFLLKEAAKNGNGHVLAVITASAQKTLSSKEFMADTAKNTPAYEAKIKAIAEIMGIVKERDHWIEYERNKGKKDET